MYKTTTLRVVNDFNTFSNKTLEIYKYFLIATINKSKLLDLLNKVINDITNIKCKNFFISIKYIVENELTNKQKENKKLAIILYKCVFKQEIDNNYDEFLNYKYRNNKDIFEKIINKLREKNEELVDNFNLNFEFNFKTEEEKKEIISEKINYILNICYGNYESSIQTKLFIFNFLYKYYNKTNNIKELIDLAIEDKYNSLKEEIANSKENNIDLYYRKYELYYLEKIKAILNLNKKEFNDFRYSLINYRFIVNLASNYNTEKQLNKNKLDELCLIKNRNKLKRSFEISIEHYKNSVYREETYKIETEDYEDYNGMLTIIMSLQKRIYNINPKWLLKQTEQLKEILINIIYRKELPNNEEINSFLYFELKYRKGYFIKTLEDIKLNLINEEQNINKINYYIKFIDSLKYYYDNVFYLTYDLINKNIQEIKLIDYLNSKILLPQYKDELFNLGIKDIIQKYKYIINNITLQNKLKETTLKEKSISNITLKRNIKKVIKIEVYNHDNIILRIKTIKDILTKKHLIDKYNFEQENELIKKALYFLLKEKNLNLNIQTEIKKFLLLETKFDISRMTKIFNETRNEFENKLKFCNKTNIKQYTNYLGIITTIDRLEKEIKDSFVSLDIEETKRINLINGCIEFLLDNKKNKDPEQVQNAEQFLLYNIKHHRETVENIFVRLTFKFKDDELLSNKLIYLQKRLLGRIGF